MKAYFPWICRRIDALFFVESWDVVKVCPCCGPQPGENEKDNAFETGHVTRLFMEDFGVKK